MPKSLANYSSLQVFIGYAEDGDSWGMLNSQALLCELTARRQQEARAIQLNAALESQNRQVYRELDSLKFVCASLATLLALAVVKILFF